MCNQSATLGGGVCTLVYDAENRLQQVKQGSTVLASYTLRQAQGEPYDADGNRVKIVMNGETVTTIGNLYEKKVVGGATTHTKYYYFNGQRVAVRVAGVLYWLLRDHLGSTTVTADGSTGARTGELWYKPWGESRGTPYGATPTKRRFTGQVLDEVAGGLYFYNARTPGRKDRTHAARPSGFGVSDIRRAARFQPAQAGFVLVAAVSNRRTLSIAPKFLSFPS